MPKIAMSGFDKITILAAVMVNILDFFSEVDHYVLAAART